MARRTIFAFAVAAGVCFQAQCAIADEPDTTHNSILTRPTLLDGPGSPKEALRARGIIVDFSVSHFYQGLVSGEGSKDWQFGSKADAVVTLDGGKLGLWQGLYVTVHQEWVWGEDANRQGDGSLLPVNTAMAFPRLGGYERDTSIIVTQAFNPQLSISVGKFNMFDVAAKTPLLGGGGLDTFMHMGIAAPISGVTPPYVVGVSATFKTEPAVFNLFIYDPRNAQDWDVVKSPFSEGTTTSLSVVVPVKVAGLSGSHGVRAVHSSKTGLDLDDVPQLLLPPEIAGVAGTKSGYWYLSYSLQQYLYQNPANPQEGWGVFGHVAISDGNPNPIQSSWYTGIGGTSFLPGRSLDRWGIAYFRYNLSDDLLAGLETLGIDLRDEQGLEAYYNIALTPWFRLTGNVEYINSFRPDRDDIVFLGLRSQVKF